MVKYYLPFIAFLIGLALLLPMVALAVQDVVVSEEINVYIADPGTTLKLSPATVDEIQVTDTAVIITMSAGGDAVIVTSPDRYKFTVSGIINPGTTCRDSSSIIIIPSQGSAKAVTLDPSTVCESIGGGGGAAVPPTSTPAKPTTTTGEVTATASGGGKTTVTSTENTTASADLPANAVTANTTVTITPTATTAAAVSTAVAAVPTGKSMVGGYVYNYTATAAGVAVTSFAQTVTLTLTYTDAQIAGLSEGTLKVYRWTGTAWQALSSVVNTATNTITATTTAFSYFAIMGEPTVVGCSCTAWVNDVCGGGTCAATERRQTRICTPAGCLVESQCLTDLTCAPAVAKPISEMTIAELKAEIARIAALILQLQAELNKLLGVQLFTSDLYYGMKANSEVKRLQEFLISKGYLASGFNTGNYLSLTVEAVKAYQQTKGITPVAGYFGPKTRTAVNADLGISQ